jgi:hypothetical protein
MIIVIYCTKYSAARVIVPFGLNATVVNEGVYQLLVHIWLKVMGFLTANSSNLVEVLGVACFLF